MGYLFKKMWSLLEHSELEKLTKVIFIFGRLPPEFYAPPDDGTEGKVSIDPESPVMES